MVKCVNCIHLTGIAINSNESEEKSNSLKCNFYHQKITLNKTKIDRDCKAFEDF
jgi:hypothetical protein